jgi:hypothetical protein
MIIFIPKELTAGVLGVGIRLSIKGFIEEIFDAGQSQKIPMAGIMMSEQDNADLLHSNSSTSASGSGSGSGSTEPGKNPQGRVITDSDYELSESDEDYHMEDDDDPNESEVSKFIYSNDFKDRVKRLTKEETAEAINTIGFMKEEYEKSKVPAAEKQIEMLNEKETLCLERLEEILKEEEESNIKGKGKEEESNIKGKGKEKEN